MVVLPVIRILQQSLTIDPSGFRHTQDPAKGFIKELTTAAGGQLDFGTLQLSSSQQVSETKCVYARAASLGTASGIFNMKFYLSSVSAWNNGTFRFLEDHSLDFISSAALTAANSDTPTSVPANANTLGTVHEAAGWPRGKGFMSGILDNDVTEYIYLSLLAHNDMEGRTYGTSGWTYRLIYDF
jgi:hypothetical protein